MVQELRRRGITLRVALTQVRMRRATYYRGRRCRPEEQRLREQIRELALAEPAFGYRRITATLRRQGWPVNPKRVYRLYRQLELQKAVSKKGRRGQRPTVHFVPTEAIFPGQVWAVDFIHDTLASGRSFRILNVLDVHSRFVFPPLVEHSITGVLAARHLEQLFLRFGAPRVLRRDRGPEFGAKVFQKLLASWRVQDEPVPPGQPYDNGHMESFHGSMRAEFLDTELFPSLSEARGKAEAWIGWYNSKRPHQSLGYRTPLELWESVTPHGAPVATLPTPHEGLPGNLNHVY